jgi:hypothetical protein
MAMPIIQTLKTAKGKQWIVAAYQKIQFIFLYGEMK